MPSSTEIESKFSLNADEFDRVRHSAKIQQCVKQLNVYFDKSWRLANLSATFRLRFSEGSAPMLTLKLPVSTHAGPRVMREFEYELPMGTYSQETIQSGFDVDRDLPPEVGERLLALGLNRLQYLGGMQNCRYIIVVDDLGSLELDDVSLPDGTHYYEAEIEDPDLERHQRLADWLHRAAPSARRSHVSKFQRFREAVSTVQLAELASSIVAESLRANSSRTPALPPP
jgi:uncharacterized protein YjbK